MPMLGGMTLKVSKAKYHHYIKLPEYIKNLILIMICLLFSMPMIMLFFGSFKTLKEADMVWRIFPKEAWRFENYVEVFRKTPIIRSAANGAFISAATIFILITVSAMCSFVIARRSDKIVKLLYAFFIGGLTLPVSFIPLIKVLQLLHISNSYAGVIIVFSSIGIPFNVFLITGFVKTVPREMDESAVIDGCKNLRLFLSIILPLLKPVITVATINIFTFVWNNFMIPLYLLGDPKQWTLPMTIFNFFGMYFKSWNLVFADMVITAVPCVLVLVLAQKQLVAGFTAGAIKG